MNEDKVFSHKRILTLIIFVVILATVDVASLLYNNGSSSLMINMSGDNFPITIYIDEVN